MSIGEIASVAKALGALADRVVFIGGAVAPLLHTERVLPHARATRDVDGVVASVTYGDYDKFGRAMRKRMFTRTTDMAGHAHRWRSPDGILFDLVPAGDHMGGSGSALDALALQAPVVVTIDGVTVRHVSAALFIAMKLQAYQDRGEGDLQASHDIEDVIALIASRPSIGDDVKGAPDTVRTKIAEFAAALATSDVAEDILTGHLNNADNVSYAVRVTRERLAALAGSPRTALTGHIEAILKTRPLDLPVSISDALDDERGDRV